MNIVADPQYLLSRYFFKVDQRFAKSPDVVLVKLHHWMILLRFLVGFKRFFKGFFKSFLVDFDDLFLFLWLSSRDFIEFLVDFKNFFGFLLMFLVLSNIPEHMSKFCWCIFHIPKKLYLRKLVERAHKTKLATDRFISVVTTRFSVNN